MGKPTSQPEPTIQHFSHPHPLYLTNLQPQQSLQLASCSGCKLSAASGWYYTCQICNYFLHVKCAQFPQQIKHPFDQNHVFSLLPTPIYPEGFFKCDACGKQGNGFSYHCRLCGTDLHVLCASLPLSTTHQSHFHQLNLTFSLPYNYSQSFCCDICKSTGYNHWLYRCNLCEFDAHLTCATTTNIPIQKAPIQIQQYQQAPAVPVVQAVVQPPIQVPIPMQSYQTMSAQYAVRPNMQNYHSNSFVGLGNQGGYGAVSTPAMHTNNNASNLINQVIHGLVGIPLGTGHHSMGGGGGAGQLLQGLMGIGPIGGGGGGNIGSAMDVSVDSTGGSLDYYGSGGGDASGDGSCVQALQGIDGDFSGGDASGDGSCVQGIDGDFSGADVVESGDYQNY